MVLLFHDSGLTCNAILELFSGYNDEDLPKHCKNIFPVSTMIPHVDFTVENNIYLY